MASTIQTRAVLAALTERGHATNADIHAALTRRFPELSLTSVHRITARLLERGDIGLAPSDGRQVVLDARSDSHDHFVCTECGGIVDVDFPVAAIDAIQRQLGSHLVRDGIVVHGRCERCGITAERSALA